jgi:endonuclease G
LLQEFGWLKIYRETGKVLEFEYLTIIQHPSGEHKQIAIRENKLIKELANSLRYSTDTAPGSSGSCVFNDQWQVVALHNMGVPEMDGDKYVTVDGRKVKEEDIRDEREIKWIANQGIRLSKIIEHVVPLKKDSFIEELFVKNILLSTQEFNLFIDDLNRKIQESYQSRTPHPNFDNLGGHVDGSSLPALVKEKTAITSNVDSLQHKISVTLPVTIEVGIGGVINDLLTEVSTTKVVRGVSNSVVVPQESIQIDPEYSNRNGFEKSFLDEGKFILNLPVLNFTNKKLIAYLKTDPKKYILNYCYYSVVMNKTRRMPFFTAVNIEGASYESIKRKSQGNDKWFTDPPYSI